MNTRGKNKILDLKKELVTVPEGGSRLDLGVPGKRQSPGVFGLTVALGDDLCG